MNQIYLAYSRKSWEFTIKHPEKKSWKLQVLLSPNEDEWLKIKVKDITGRKNVVYVMDVATKTRPIVHW